MNILSVFSCSTFNPIQLHMGKIGDSVVLLPSFLEASYAAKWESALSIQQKMDQKHVLAKTLKQQILLQATINAFGSIDSRDLFDLLAAQSKIASLVQS